MGDKGQQHSDSGQKTGITHKITQGFIRLHIHLGVSNPPINMIHLLNVISAMQFSDTVTTYKKEVKLPINSVLL